MISDLEEKNRHMNDIVNSHLVNKAQAYQDTVMNKLLNQRSPVPSIPFGEVTNTPGETSS